MKAKGKKLGIHELLLETRIGLCALERGSIEGEASPFLRATPVVETLNSNPCYRQSEKRSTYCYITGP